MADRKKFIDVEVPILDNTIQVLGTVKNLTGKTIKLDLSRKMRGKGVVITLQIFEKDEKLVAVPKRIELMNSYLIRVIRKRTDNVEDSFLAHCSDLRATVKPFLITRKKVSRAVRRSLRNVAREFLLNELKDKTYYEVCEEILEGSLQKSMLPKLKKVYPLALCDIRIFETKDLAKLDLASVVSRRQVVEEDTEAPLGVPQDSELEGKTEVEAEKEVEEEAVEEVVEEVEAEKEVEEEAVEEVVEEVEAEKEVEEEEKKEKKTLKKATSKKVEDEADAIKE